MFSRNRFRSLCTNGTILASVVTLAALALPTHAATLIDYEFDGSAGTGPDFQQVTNGLNTGGSSNLTTGLITTGNGVNSNYGFNNDATIDIPNLDPSATGFYLTFEVAATTANVSSLGANGLFFGIVSGAGATGTGATNLWNQDPLAFGFVAGSTSFGDHLMRQKAALVGGSAESTALTTTAPSNLSYQDGFTFTLGLFDNDTWSVSSTGLSTNLNQTGSLNTTIFSYADIADDVGAYVSLQGQGSSTLTVDRITLVTVPEPSAFAILGLGVASLVGLARFRRR